jgi:hypothetical protein
MRGFVGKNEVSGGGSFRALSARVLNCVRHSHSRPRRGAGKLIIRWTLLKADGAN